MLKEISPVNVAGLFLNILASYNFPLSNERTLSDMFLRYGHKHSFLNGYVLLRN